jgi:hypothetical protein
LARRISSAKQAAAVMHLPSHTRLLLPFDKCRLLAPLPAISCSQEPDCITIGDYTVVEDGSFFMAHTVEDRTLKFTGESMGEACVVLDIQGGSEHVWFWWLLTTGAVLHK